MYLRSLSESSFPNPDATIIGLSVAFSIITLILLCYCCFLCFYLNAIGKNIFNKN